MKKNILSFLLTIYNDIYVDDVYRMKNKHNNLCGLVGIHKISSILTKIKFIFVLLLPLIYITIPIILLVHNCSLLFYSILKKMSSTKFSFATIVTNEIHLLTQENIISNINRINHKERYWMCLPFKKHKKINNGVIIDCFSIINYKDIFVSFYCALVSAVLIIKRFGYNKILLAFKSYIWFLFYYGAIHIPYNYTIYVGNQKDRWAILVDRLPHLKKIIIQHGTEIIRHNAENIKYPLYKHIDKYAFWVCNMPYKLKNINEIYAFSEKESLAMKESILSCCPIFKYYGYGINLTEIPRTDSILIIGHYPTCGDKEEQIISKLQKYKIKIYLKNHPVVNSHCYDDMLKKYTFELITERDFFPKVKLVISYNSTLAYGYENLGIDVLYYNDIDISNDKSIQSIAKKVVK